MQFHEDQKYQSHPEDLVNVYLVLVSFKNKKVRLYKHISFQDLRFRIKEQFEISEQFQILYYKGEMLSADSMRELTEKTIIHIGDSRRIVQEKLTIYLLQYNSDGRNLFRNNGLRMSIEVNSNDLVGEALRQGMIENDYYDKIYDWTYISYGRFLHEDKSFKEQHIQNNSNIQIIIKKIRRQPELQSSNKMIIQSNKQLENNMVNDSKLKQQDKNLIDNGNLQQQDKNVINDSNYNQTTNNVTIYQDEIKQGHGQEQEQQQQQLLNQNHKISIKYITHNNPQFSINKKASFQTCQLINSQSEVQTPLRKFKSAKTLKTSEIISRNVVCNPLPMKFRLRDYNRVEKGFVGQRQCNCVSKRHLYQNQQCIKNAEFESLILNKSEEPIKTVKNGQKAKKKSITRSQTLIN